MYISKIRLKDFRNYETAEIGFEKNFNIFYGQNGQGKTNILEAMFLCASGRSHRTSKDADLVRMGEDGYLVEVGLQKDRDFSVIEVAYRKEGKKSIRINEVHRKRIGELMGHLNAVIFSPEDLLMVKEGPSERRRFLDIALSQLRPTYFFDLQQYMKVLFQRNMLLKEIQLKKNLMGTLDVWNINLAKTGARIMKARNTFIERLDMLARKNHTKLTNGVEEIEISYVPSVRTSSFDIGTVEKEFLGRLESSVEKELARCSSLYGPQRDDYDIKINGISLKQYGSQGQQRTAVLSLKLSEIDIMHEETGEYPVLLLDDVMSELDGRRQEYLFQNLEKIQTFITCTDKGLFEGKFGIDSVFFNVNRGVVSAEGKQG